MRSRGRRVSNETDDGTESTEISEADEQTSEIQTPEAATGGEVEPSGENGEAASIDTGKGESPAWLAAPWTFKRWVALLAAFAALVVGAGIGAASQSGRISELEDKNSALAEARDRLEREGERLQEQVNDRDAKTRADEAAARRVEAEKEAAERKKAEDEAAAAAAAAAAEAAAEAERNTIPGNGIYAIGPEKAPGRYRTDGPSGSNPVGCYYALLRAPTSDSIDNIIDNNIVNGPGFADLIEGQFFETTSCQPWTRVG